MTFTRRIALSGERTKSIFAGVHPVGSERRDALRFTVESLREGFGR